MVMKDIVSVVGSSRRMEPNRPETDAFGLGIHGRLAVFSLAEMQSCLALLVTSGRSYLLASCVVIFTVGVRVGSGRYAVQYDAGWFGIHVHEPTVSSFDLVDATNVSHGTD